MTKEKLNEVTEIVKKSIQSYYSNNADYWFKNLSTDSIWICDGEPMLFGKDEIKRYFKKRPSPGNVNVLNETYSAISLDKNSAIVFGQITVGMKKSSKKAITMVTIGIRCDEDEPKIAYHHLSYDYYESFTNNATNLEKKVDLDVLTRRYIKNLLLENMDSYRVAIKFGTQTLYVDLNTVIYLQSKGHHTTIFCINEIIDSTMGIGEIEKLLNKNFCKVRRGTIINTQYVTAIRHYEIEMLYKTVIKIPQPSYANIKETVNSLILQQE